MSEYYMSSRASVVEARTEPTPRCVHCGKVLESRGMLYRHYGGCY
jgi:hypothetical protein